MLITGATMAQEAPAPVIGPRGVQHGATYRSLAAQPFVGEPGGVAPGAVFVLQGSGLGPGELVQGTAPYGLRLPDIPGGTEIRVRSIGTGKVFQASMIYAWDRQIAAILPRNFPLGDAEVRVWYQGRVSELANVPIVYSFPGLFALTQNGVGRAVIQNVEAGGGLTLNGLTHSAKPGQYVTLWGTGLGDAREDEVRVYFGDEFYPAAYAGPAPGIPGVDQFNVRLPDNLPDRGCYVRLVVAGDGLGSGPASIAISDEGGACQHPWGISPERLAEIEAGARATSIRLNLWAGVSTVERDQPPPPAPTSGASGYTSLLDESTLERTVVGEAILHDLDPRMPGVCQARPLRSGPIVDFPVDPGPQPPQPSPTTPSEDTPAGYPWLLTGPGGRSLELTPVGDPALGAVDAGEQAPGFFTPGDWTVRVPGGADIGPLELTVRMPALPEIASPAALQRGEDFELTWPVEGIHEGDEAGVQVLFWAPDPETPGAYRGEAFSCVADPAAGRVRIAVSSGTESLEDVTEGEIRFTLRRHGSLAALPGVDRVETTGSVVRAWSVPVARLAPRRAY